MGETAVIREAGWLLLCGWMAGLLHEVAHAVTASACGLRVNRVVVGLGPGLTLPTVGFMGGTSLRLGVLPVAGWCEVEALRSAPPAVRALVYLAGGLANLVVAVVVASVSPYGSPAWKLAVVNFALAMVSLVPVPTFDGWWVLAALLSAVAGPSREARAQTALAAIAVSQAALVLVAGTAAVASAAWPRRDSASFVVVAAYLLVAAVCAGLLLAKRRKRAGK